MARAGSALFITLTLSVCCTLSAQRAPGAQGSRNVHVLSHLPLGRIFTVSHVKIDQQLSRPYAYLPRHGTCVYRSSLDRVEGGDHAGGWGGPIATPDTTGGGSLRDYHDMYAGSDPASRQDRFYGAGASGYYVFDVTDLANPRLIT